MATVRSQRELNYILKNLGPVQDALDKEADEIAAKAEVNLAAHRYKGRARITKTRGKVDRYVNLEDRKGGPKDSVAAWAIEYGHYNHRTGKWTQGIYVLTRAAGLI